jgi:hypothetical protein
LLLKSHPVVHQKRVSLVRVSRSLPPWFNTTRLSDVHGAASLKQCTLPLSKGFNMIGSFVFDKRFSLTYFLSLA